MINEYSLLLRRLVTLAASCWGRWRGLHSPHCSGVKPIGCVHKFHHIAEQNVIGSARIACLCFKMKVWKDNSFLARKINFHCHCICVTELLLWTLPFREMYIDSLPSQVKPFGHMTDILMAGSPCSLLLQPTENIH